MSEKPKHCVTLEDCTELCLAFIAKQAQDVGPEKMTDMSSDTVDKVREFLDDQIRGLDLRPDEDDVIRLDVTMNLLAQSISTMAISAARAYKGQADGEVMAAALVFNCSEKLLKWVMHHMDQLRKSLGLETFLTSELAEKIDAFAATNPGPDEPITTVQAKQNSKK